MELGMNAVVNDKKSGPDHERDARQRIVLLDENFQSRETTLDDTKVTGRQIAEAAGYNSTDEVIVLQQLANGALEEIRPEELANLAPAGAERFFVIVGDATYRFILDGLKLEWARPAITANTMRRLARKGDDVDVVQELESAPDRILDDDDVIDLTAEGTERFKTKPAAKLVTVYYGEVEHKLPKGVYTTEQLIDQFKVESGYLLDLVVNGKLVELKPGEKLRLKNDMHFTSHPPRGQSS
jgi:hypothetical protein